MKAKKLIEVAMPIKEISAESVRDKSIRHGHISTLHLWWARRPLPACRAIVFCSLVPDPLDENCPKAFKEAVTKLLAKNPLYKVYPDIPYTAIYDPMEDNLRNRLMMFVGKFSDKCQKNMLAGKSTLPAEQLSDGCLVKWENRNNRDVIDLAQELIFVAYQSSLNSSASYDELHSSFRAKKEKIRNAEEALYLIVDRHLSSPEIRKLESNLQEAIADFRNFMPSVLDPFAGGGAIPMEAARLGCRTYGNDINPVAHIIEKASAEFPQKYGKKIVFSKAEFERVYGRLGLQMLSERDIVHFGETVEIPNRLSFDIEFYSRKILGEVENEVGYLYPSVDKNNKAIAYYWSRVAHCSNPSCSAEIPLMKGFYLANSPQKKVYLKPEIKGNHINFSLESGKHNLKEWNHRGNVTCPCCGNVTTVEQVKEESKTKGLKSRLLAVISDGANGKVYDLPTKEILSVAESVLPEVERPQELLPIGYIQAFPVCSWGFQHWGDIFSERQIFVLNTWLKVYAKYKEELCNDDYGQVVLTYIAIWIDRIAIANTSFGVYHTGREKLERILGRQSISMTFDYPESNPFCGKSGSAENQLEWILRYVESESKSEFYADFFNASSGEKSQFESKAITAVVTDPPYYDAIGYADCSDFFYVWLKRTLGDLYPLNFATPQTPKSDECTAIKHHHEDDAQKAKVHFENKLTQIFDAIEEQTNDIVSIMFAHQSTEAWTTLCNSILGARMNITGSWPMDTEMQGALKTDMSFLESSVTVACRPSERRGFGDYRQVKKDIDRKVEEEVRSLYALGFRGADLLTACFGQAVSEFGKYKKVENAQGDEVTVAQLLDMTRTSAFNALLHGFEGDPETQFYIGWLQLNGTGDTDHDDATKFTRVGVNIEIKDVIAQQLLVKGENNKQHLASADEHLTGRKGAGLSAADPLIDQVHRAMIAYKASDRVALLKQIKECGQDKSNPFWRVISSLKELLPAGDDLQQVEGLLQNADSLIADSKKRIQKADVPELGLDFD